MTDEEILREYYNNVYNSEMYKRYKSTEWGLIFFTNNKASSEKFVKFSKLLLLATIYYFIFRIADVIEFRVGNLIPIAYILISVLVLLISKKKLKKAEQDLETAIYHYQNSKSEFAQFKNEISVPPIPATMDCTEGIQELLAVFQSKRADTFKEALIIYEQDCQHRELVRRQNALISAANNAQREAEEAKKVAEQAKRDADFARWDAEYHRWND
ncbi:MAG: hypothetical protein J6K22_10520 [Spirochaetaceae bacterium]|nr:hypothetical protein [Spirochaetaceae bacterium]